MTSKMGRSHREPTWSATVDVCCDRAVDVRDDELVVDGARLGHEL